MSTTVSDIEIRENVKLSTWFRVGGDAERFAQPASPEQLQRCLELDPQLRILGEGANLLVADDGVSELVVSLAAMDEMAIDGNTVRVGAGAPLPKVITACVKAGLAGLETIAGIPATIGGAVVMNAGGSFGTIGDRVASVTSIDRSGAIHERAAETIGFDYRRSAFGKGGSLEGEIVTAVTFELESGDPEALNDRLIEVMGYKKNTQPMGERSAGCAFRNPTLAEPIDGIGDTGERVSAGLLIDRAGCKGMKQGGALVSELHGNFITTRDGAKASDVIGLMVEVAFQVRQKFGVTLEPEVVIWRRTQA